MLEEKLDFLPVAESIELFDSEVELDTRFWWVMRSEELENNGEDMTTEELFEAYDELYGLGSDYGLTIGDRHEQFDEFTLELCPAVTYIDLIR